MELLIVRTEDVYPDENNIREDFGGTEELAEGFWLNPERPGEPVQPPVVVRDGGIYRIYDGERRYRAIVRNGLESFTANVCESLEEADAYISMLATDDKKPLTELEKSRGVQRALLLGVDPVKVEKAARLPEGSAAKVLRARKVVDDAGDDLTLDRMYAVYELRDDPVAAMRVAECEEGSWRLVAQRISNERREERWLEDVKAAADRLGIDLVPDDEVERDPRWRYKCSPGHGDDAVSGLEKYAAKHTGSRYGYRGRTVYAYVPAGSGEGPAVDAGERKAALALSEASRAAFSEVRAWFAGGFRRAKCVYPNVRDLAAASWKDLLNFKRASEAFPGLCDSAVPSRAGYAAGFVKLLPEESLDEETAFHVLKGNDNYYTRGIPRIAEVFAAAERDGFAFSEASRPMKEALDAHMRARDAGGEGGE